jgi:hypothetical protein
MEEWDNRSAVPPILLEIGGTALTPCIIGFDCTIRDFQIGKLGIVKQ